MLIGYTLLKNNQHQKEKISKVIHIEQMRLPAAIRDEDEKSILSDLKQYIEKNRQYNNSTKKSEEEILKELKMFTSKNEIIAIRDQKNSLIKKKVKISKKAIHKNSKHINKKTIEKIDKKIVVTEQNTLDEIENTIENSNEEYIISDAYELKKDERELKYGEIETIATSPAYKIDEAGPIRAPIDISTNETDTPSLEELNFVQTLGVVEVSKPYLSNDEVM
jgi:hypothetical protein